jgi:ribonuclease HI
VLIINVDGGARGNPGPAAIGIVIARPDGSVVEEISETIGAQTNNVAEYRAVLRALERARELGESEIRLIGDSELVAKQIHGIYRVRHPVMRELFSQAQALLAEFSTWSLDTVPRSQNAAADALVNRALDAAP